MAGRRITIDEITKIEGHANLTITIEEDKLKNLKFGVHEGSRYFEAFMLNRQYHYLPELSARICGICTVAHEIASVQAVEQALEIDPGETVHSIRKLMLYSSHIQSHILHLYFLALPDYMGTESTIELSGRDSYSLELVKKAFAIKEATNYMTAIFGGRAVHPCTIVPGGHTNSIEKSDIERYVRKMKEIYPLLVETAELFLSLEYSPFERESEYVALVDAEKIPLYHGDIGTTHMRFPPAEYMKHLREWTVDYSSAKRSLVDGKNYMVGALSRLNLNSHLRGEVREIADRYSLRFPSNRVAWINAAQSLENVHYAIEAMELADSLSNGYSGVVSKPRTLEGEGVSAIEAPRGLLIHHYRFSKGKCTYANIITPTAMNTANIERNLREYVSQIIHRDDTHIKMEVEKIIRAYDPCISCSVHVAKTK